MQIILENLYKAYFEARKNKRFTKEQLKFEQNYEHQLQLLYEQIITKTYKVAPCKAFAFLYILYKYLKIFPIFAACKVLKNILLLTQKTCKGRNFFVPLSTF